MRIFNKIFVIKQNKNNISQYSFLLINFADKKRKFF